MTFLAWALEELGLRYEVIVHVRTSLGVAPPSLKQISPLGKVLFSDREREGGDADEQSPVFEFDDEVLFESANIINRLIAYARVHNLRTQDIQLNLTNEDILWTTFAEGSLTNYFQHSLILTGAATNWEKGIVKASRGSETEVRKEAAKFAKWVNVSLSSCFERGEV